MKLLNIIYESVIDMSEAPKTTQDEFIKRAKLKHGEDRYDYSKTVYDGKDKKVEIICHKKDENGIEHGPFMQTPSNHLAGRGCRKCGTEYVNKLNSKDNNHFINKSNEIHGKGRYDYSDVNYDGMHKKVKIICHKKDEEGNEHGPFMQTPNNHLQGNGCPICSGKTKKTTSEFIQQAKLKQGEGRYDYSKVNYINNETPVEIICHKKDEDGNEHGAFMQTPSNHLQGNGCPICGGRRKIDTELFIKRAKEVHGENRYDYSDVNYTTARTKVIITCHKKDAEGNEHGPFLQEPMSHLKGNGCPICSESHGEKKIGKLLDENNIRYNKQHQFEYCYSIVKSSVNKICRKLSFDYYLPDFNTLIEFDGLYHFEKHFNSRNDSFMLSIVNDREKNSYTKLKGIKLIRISYLDKNNIVNEIIEGLKSKDQLYLSTNYPRGEGWDDDSFQPTAKFIKKYT